MALVGSYSVSGPSSSLTLSSEYSTLDELLIQIPDNTQNLITPGDLRDSVYTLWQRVQSVNVIAASAASASSYFVNPDPTTVSVGGITAGSTFPTPVDMQTMWNQLLYPYVAPTAALSIAGGLTDREYGNPVGLASNSITLNWSVTRNTASNLITLIQVEGSGYLPNGGSQTGTKLVTGTHSWNTSSVSQTQTFTMNCQDDYVTTFGASVNLNWMNRIYWGKIDLSSVGNPNLTFSPGSVSLVTPLCTDSVVCNLTGAGVGSGNQLSTTKSKTYSGINGSGNYLIFAWPSSVSGALSPTFTVNGLPNTAFTRVRTASPLSNNYGFVTNYEVWVSNTAQNSPLNIVIT